MTPPAQVRFSGTGKDVVNVYLGSQRKGARKEGKWEGRTGGGEERELQRVVLNPGARARAFLKLPGYAQVRLGQRTRGL